jgi:hypothetical protein
VQTNAFTEDLAGMVQLLAQAQAVLTGVAPPLLHRMHGSLERILRPVPQNQPADAPANSLDTTANRLALQTQLRNLAFGVRRIGDSLRGLATLLEAVQVDPMTGAASLLILPPHLQAGRQMSLATVPGLQVHVQQGAGPIMQIPLGVQIGAQPEQPAAAVSPNVVSPPAPAAPAQSAAPVPAPGPAPAPASAQPQPVNPLQMLLQQLGQPPQAAPVQDASQPQAQPQQQQPQQFDFMQMLGPMMANLGQAAVAGGMAAAAPAPARAEGQPQQPPVNPFAGIMQALGPMFAGLQVPGQPVAPAQAQAPANVAPAAPAAPAANASLSEVRSAGAPVAAAVPQPAPPVGAPGAPSFGNMFQQLMPMVGQLISNPGAAGGGSLADIMGQMLGQLGGGAGGAGAGGPAAPAAIRAVAGDGGEQQIEGVRGADPEEEESASLFDMLLNQVMQHLSLPDLMVGGT